MWMKHKILLAFDIQMNHPIQVGRLDLVLVKNKTCQRVDLNFSPSHKADLKESEWLIEEEEKEEECTVLLKISKILKKALK